MHSHWMTELIGLLAGVCTTLSLVPQLHRIWKAKRAPGLSLEMFFVFGVGVMLWLLYGIGIRSFAVITTNSVSLVLVIAIYSLAVHYEHRASAALRALSPVNCTHEPRRNSVCHEGAAGARER